MCFQAIVACLCLFFPMGSHWATPTAHGAVRICMFIITMVEDSEYLPKFFQKVLGYPGYPSWALFGDMFFDAPFFAKIRHGENPGILHSIEWPWIRTKSVASAISLSHNKWGETQTLLRGIWYSSSIAQSNKYFCVSRLGLGTWSGELLHDHMQCIGECQVHLQWGKTLLRNIDMRTVFWNAKILNQNFWKDTSRYFRFKNCSFQESPNGRTKNRNTYKITNICHESLKVKYLM